MSSNYVSNAQRHYMQLFIEQVLDVLPCIKMCLIF